MALYLSCWDTRLYYKCILYTANPRLFIKSIFFPSFKFLFPVQIVDIDNSNDIGYKHTEQTKMMIMMVMIETLTKMMRLNKMNLGYHELHPHNDDVDRQR